MNEEQKPEGEAPVPVESAPVPVEAPKVETGNLPVPEKVAAQIDSVFTYHKPKDEETAARCQEVRDAFKLHATYLAKKVPESRELSLALTHLELASMEAIAGIVRNQENAK